jgi:ABC-type sulfate transport system permease subunit
VSLTQARGDYAAILAVVAAHARGDTTGAELLVDQLDPDRARRAVAALAATVAAHGGRHEVLSEARGRLLDLAQHPE